MAPIAIILVTHRGESKAARLPGRVSAPSALPIPSTPPSGPTSLAWRLPVSTSVALPSTRDELQPTVPWSARDLTPRSATACRQCGEAVVPEDRLDVWKDLPSENWAEMMDFWHCHKPHDHDQEKNGDDGDDEHLTKRGYGANSSIAAQTRVGFVDLTSFLLAEEDCINLRPFPIPVSPGEGLPDAPMRTPLFFSLAARATARFMWSSGMKRAPSQGPIREFHQRGDVSSGR
ncbi:conserved hypothetical protein [Verticillium alfalfae VaMs.102]|uniref:Uncharacterized protein n=1 Tax=Verticillium alfalfae (strain VaMs.102 / ATCC MYA-4576 / FGSC 10136) TaxID=526221 RepID=C9SM25_VERA1|nr:conserved hypothetical protein [Verticillium alfalfae VaMs.102]EEY19840.1 conserved hypothetical protein [Verticillium alfalfae VaMs.102]